jgi:hypothetical protein
MESIDIETVYPHFEEACQAADPQDLCAMMAGRRDREAYTVSASIVEKGHRGGESLHALARQNLREIMVFADLLSGTRVDRRSLGDDAVHVEDEGIEMRHVDGDPPSCSS